MDVTRNLEHLHMAASVESQDARDDALSIVVGMFTQKELKALVMVMAVGALHGPNDARSLAGRLK